MPVEERDVVTFTEAATVLSMKKKTKSFPNQFSDPQVLNELSIPSQYVVEPKEE
jgi:hypothetical protein